MQPFGQACFGHGKQYRGAHAQKQGGHNGGQPLHDRGAATPHDKKSGYAAQEQRKAVAGVVQMADQSVPAIAFIFKKASAKDVLERGQLLRRKCRGCFDGTAQKGQRGDAPGQKAEQQPQAVPPQAVVGGPVEKKDCKQHAAGHKGADAVQVHAAARNKKDDGPQLWFIQGGKRRRQQQGKERRVEDPGGDVARTETPVRAEVDPHGHACKQSEQGGGQGRAQQAAAQIIEGGVMEKNARRAGPQQALRNVAAGLQQARQRGLKVDDGIGRGGHGQQRILCKQPSVQLARDILGVAAKVAADGQPVGGELRHPPQANQGVAGRDKQEGQIPKRIFF